MRSEMVQVRRDGGDDAGENRDMKHKCVSGAGKEKELMGNKQLMIQFYLSVVCELVFSEEVHFNLKGLVVQKVSVRDCRLSLALCRFNAASLPTNLSQLTNVLRFIAWRGTLPTHSLHSSDELESHINHGKPTLSLVNGWISIDLQG